MVDYFRHSSCTIRGMTARGHPDPGAYMRLAALLREQITDGKLAPGRRGPDLPGTRARLLRQLRHIRPAGSLVKFTDHTQLLTWTARRWVTRVCLPFSSVKGEGELMGLFRR